MNWKILSLASAALLLGCAPIAETTGWDASDRNAVGYDEYVQGFQDLGAYDQFDTNHNGVLSEDEWRAGLGNRFGTYDAYRWGPFPDWDTDRSGGLSQAEFSRGVFDRYDTNRDSMLVGEESATFEREWK